MTARRAPGAAALVALAALLAGCSWQIGDVEEVAQYRQVESDGVALEVLDGMEAAPAPDGFAAFWQTTAGTSTVSVGIAPGAEPAQFVEAQVAEMGRVMDDVEFAEHGDDAVRFAGTGVDGERYTGLIAVRGSTGVLVSADEDADSGVLQHVVDSVAAAP
ncbi:hypothetical protein [Isoptericola sp. NPDC019482]|uniref:hypothetical protein n=1 Tax=Isoptericola sp. NPDC019482 TaxID=3154688 RepID=UPI00347A70D0